MVSGSSRSQRAVDTYDEASLGACKIKRLDRGEIAFKNLPRRSEMCYETI